MAEGALASRASGRTEGTETMVRRRLLCAFAMLCSPCIALLRHPMVARAPLSRVAMLDLNPVDDAKAPLVPTDAGAKPLVPTGAADVSVVTDAGAKPLVPTGAADVSVVTPKLPFAKEIDGLLTQQLDFLDAFLVITGGFIFSLQTLPDLTATQDLSLRVVQDAIVVFFGLEFAARWYARDLAPRFLTEPFNMIRLLSFAPFSLALYESSAMRRSSRTHSWAPNRGVSLLVLAHFVA
jgi:hypothetical protein